MLAVIDNEGKCLGSTRAKRVSKEERRYLIRFLN